MLLRIYSIGLIFSIFMFLIQPGICTGKSLAPGINDTVSYPGGETALQDFLFSHNIFNSSQAENSIEGIVVLRLSIDPFGYVSGKNILRGIGGEIDEEALRLTGLISFNPATDSLGQGISSEYILRIKFYPPKRIEYGDLIVVIKF